MEADTTDKRPMMSTTLGSAQEEGNQYGGGQAWEAQDIAFHRLSVTGTWMDDTNHCKSFY